MPRVGGEFPRVGSELPRVGSEFAGGEAQPGVSVPTRGREFAEWGSPGGVSSR